MPRFLPYLFAIHMPESLWAALYVAPYVALAVFLGRRIALLERAGRRVVGFAVAAALAGGLVWAAAIHANPWSSQGLFYNKDDASYDRWGREIAERWHDGERPNLERDFEIGTLHTGFYRLVSAVYYCFGPQPSLIILLNILAGAALPAALYILAFDFAGAEAARRAAWLAALYPTFWFHGAFLMRDTWIALFFVAALAAYLDIESRSEDNAVWAVARWAFLAAFVGQLFLLRYYLAGIVVAGCLIDRLAAGGKRTAVSAIALFVGVSLFATRFIPYMAELEDRVFPQFSHLLDRMIQSFTWAIPRELSSPWPVAQRFAEGLAKLFLAPLPWATKGGYVVDYFLWPGQWMLLLILLPFGLLGMGCAARHNLRQGFLLMFPFVAAGYGLIVAYGGAAPRQRMFLDALLIVFAACAQAWRIETPGTGRRWLMIYYPALALFIVAHVASLFYRGIW